MAETYPRRLLKPMRLYHEMPTGLFFYTPDGIGCVWFQDYEEAMAEVGDFGRPVISIVQRLSDFD